MALICSHCQHFGLKFGLAVLLAAGSVSTNLHFVRIFWTSSPFWLLIQFLFCFVLSVILIIFPSLVIQFRLYIFFCIFIFITAPLSFRCSFHPTLMPFSVPFLVILSPFLSPLLIPYYLGSPFPLISISGPLLYSLKRGWRVRLTTLPPSVTR
jgi:hypothetical protein